MKLSFAFLKRLMALCAVGLSLVVSAEDAYLESDGTQFVTVNYKANARTRVVADFQYADVSASQALFGSGPGLIGASGATICFWLNGGGNPESSLNGSWSGRFKTGFDTKRHQVELDVANFRASLKSTDEADINKNHTVSQVAVDNFPLSIFASTKGALTDGAYLAKARIYTFKIYEGDALLLDLVPCRKGGKAGFYNTKNGDFYPSVTKTDFVVGGNGVLELEEDPYVSSPNGKVSVLTDYFVTSNTCIEADFAFLDGETAQQFLFESDSVTNPYGRLYISGGKNYAWTFHDTVAYATFVSVGDGKSSIPLVADKRWRLILDGGSSLAVLTCSGVTNSYVTPLTGTRSKTGQSPLRLFSNATGGANFGKVKLYGFKISENGVLLHDYRPMACAGVGVLRDVVTGRTLLSNTSTPLSYGGKIKEDPYVESKGGQMVKLDYKPNAKTVVTVEYSHYAKRASTTLLGNGDMRVWLNGGGNQEFYTHGAWSGGGSGAPDGKRHTAVIDVPASMVYYQESVSNLWSTNMTAKSGYKADVSESAYALGVFRVNSETVNTNYTGAVRVYSIRVAEDGGLKHLYLPYVKNFEVGFRDQVTGNFFGAGLTALSDSTTIGLIGGGDIETDGRSPDAYIESDTSQYIQTGYYPTPNTKVELDFQMTKIKKDYYLMGCEKSPFWRVYCNYLSKFTFLSHASVNSSGAIQAMPADYGRHVATIDIKNGTLNIAHAGGTRLSDTLTGVSTATSAVQLGLFARQEPNVDYHYGRTPMKVYSLRIWEGETLVRELLPYKNGDVIGLRDTKTGVVLENCVSGANPFVIGGMGVGGSGDEFEVEPQDCVVPVDGQGELSAWAPGAVRYVWKKDGEVVAGESGAMLAIPWTQGRPHEHVYTVTPVYNVYGNEVKGSPVSATVENAKRGHVILLK